MSRSPTSNSPSNMTAMNVVSAVAWTGSLRACFTAAKAAQYCALDLHSKAGAYETLDSPAMPTASMAAPRARSRSGLLLSLTYDEASHAL